MRERVYRFACAEALFAPGDRVLAAVSGGADSVAMLHLLLTLKEELGIAAVSAAHVNHGLRGAEADRDEAFVRQLCDKWQVPLFVHHADVGALAAERHRGIEETGREVRYAFFDRIPDIDRIATAHTATDNAETVLLHLTRGSGLTGLCGIAPKRGRLVRPLLSCAREDIEAYCAAHALTYCTDGTNDDVRYARNRIRAQVLPPLKAVNPSLSAAVTRLTLLCRRDADCLDGMAKAALSSLERDENGCIRTAALLRLPDAVRFRVWQCLLTDVGRPLSFDEVCRLDDAAKTGGTLSLGRTTRVRFVRGHMEWETIGGPLSAEEEQRLIPGKMYTFCGRKYHFDFVSLDETEKSKNVHKNVLNYLADYDKISHDPKLTGRRSGDTVRPAGRNCRKTLKKLLYESDIPAAMRDRIPVLRDESGVFLVPGLACDERVRVDAHTVRAVGFFPADGTGERNGKDEQYT